jgi:putative oxidoreductase
MTENLGRIPSERAAPMARGPVLYDTGADPRPAIPALQSFYEFVVPLSWLLIRLAVGWSFLVHSWGKIMAGPAKVAPAFAELGFTNPLPWVLTSTYLELIGGLCVILGLFTRFWAAALAIELGYITFGLYWGNGFSWLHRGYEYTLMWGLLCFAIALRGGGPYSIDRKFRREL